MPVLVLSSWLLYPVLWVGRLDMEFRPESVSVPDPVSCLGSGVSFDLSDGLSVWPRMWFRLLCVSMEELLLLGRTGLKAVGRIRTFSTL